MAKSILFYFNSLQPSGGIERVITTLANKLCLEYNVTILVKDPAISFYELDSRVIFISLNNDLNFNMNNRFSRVFTALFSVINNTKSVNKYLKQNKFDYYYIAHPLNALEFHLARGIKKADTILTEHGGVDAYNFVYKYIKKVLYKKAKTYVVPTTTDTQIYQNLGFPAQYVPHFRSNLQYIKSDLKSNNLLTIGRFTSVKQHLLLLKIWKEVLAEVSQNQWKLQIVGQGELEQDYRKYVEQNEMENYVEILSPDINVSKFYQNASIFLLTSSTEGFGMVLLEAISFGLPCISFDCPAGPRDIIDSGNGFLVLQNDEVMFKNAIIKLINQPTLLQSLAEQAYKDSINWQDDNIYKIWLQILK